MVIDMSTPEKRPPHPATLPSRSTTAQPRAAAPPARPLHPATSPGTATAQARPSPAALPPHPATVVQRAVPPHPATIVQRRAAGAPAAFVQRSTQGGVRTRLYHLNQDGTAWKGGKVEQGPTKGKCAEPTAWASDQGGADGYLFVQNAWPCTSCQGLLQSWANKSKVQITVSAQGDQGGYSQDNGQAYNATGVLTYTPNGANAVAVPDIPAIY